MFVSNPKTTPRFEPMFTTRRKLLLTVATVCALLVAGVICFFKPEVWLWKNAALFVATHNRSDSTSSAALSGRYRWQDVTQEESIGVVRKFQHNTRLSIRTDLNHFPCLDDFDFLPSVSRHAYWLTDGEYNYVVCRQCASWFECSAREGSYAHLTSSKASILSPSRVEQIALQFAKAHYPRPETLRRTSGGDSAGGPTVYTYDVYFHEVAPDGTWGPGACDINVDRVDGRVIEYKQRYFPILVPTHPPITSAEAVKRVKDLMIIRHSEPARVWLEVSEPDEQGREHLYYHVVMNAIGVKDLFHFDGYVAAVDARNGEILRWHAG